MNTTRIPLEATRQRSHEPYRVSVEEYLRFQQQGFLVVRGLVGRDEMQEFLDYTDGVIDGRIAVPGIEVPPDLDDGGGIAA